MYNDKKEPFKLMEVHDELIEKYRRPCLAICRCWRKHGFIILEDGTYTEIPSKQAGRNLVAKLVKDGKLTSDDGDRMCDQINESDIYGGHQIPARALIIIGATTPDHSRN